MKIPNILLESRNSFNGKPSITCTLAHEWAKQKLWQLWPHKHPGEWVTRENIIRARIMAEMSGIADALICGRSGALTSSSITPSLLQLTRQTCKSRQAGAGSYAPLGQPGRPYPSPNGCRFVARMLAWEDSGHVSQLNYKLDRLREAVHFGTQAQKLDFTAFLLYQQHHQWNKRGL